MEWGIMYKQTALTVLITSALLIATTSQLASAEQYRDRADFASGLEETLGHFWALELNLDERNAELALIHASHPVEELYDAMKPVLKASDPDLDAQVQKTLLELKDRASTDVSREQAQQAIDDAKEVVEIARSTIVGAELSGDPAFKVGLMKVLLETSVAEYGEAVEGGAIKEMAEFQDGSAFVWRSQQILDTIRDGIDADEIDEIDAYYEDLWEAYEDRAEVSKVETITNSLMRELGSTQAAKIDFASGLEETLGHFWALELNLDERNAELALIHASHPVEELYDAMKPVLKASDPDLDAQVQKTLLELKDRASTDVSREQAQQAIDDAKEVVEIARSTIVGAELSGDPAFKVGLMKVLLETSVAEYGEAVEGGAIKEMAEFQDGSAFVWRSQQILDTIRDGIDADEIDEIDAYYEDLWEAYEDRAEVSKVEAQTGKIISEIDGILGVDGGDKDLLEYVENIRNLLEETKQAYGSGDKDLALSLATKAYLDNYEFLEAPLIELDRKDLMEEVEIMLREDLRGMIKNDDSASNVNAHIDAILAKMDTIATIVPEFGTVAMIILAIAVVSIVAVSARSRLSLRV